MNLKMLFTSLVSMAIMLFFFILLMFYGNFGVAVFESSNDFFVFLLTLASNISVFYLTILVIALMVFSWGRYYMMDSSSTTVFFLVLLMFVSSMLLLTLSSSFMSIFIGWEGLGITSFVLIIFYQNWMSMKGGLLTLLTNRLGDSVLMFVFCFWLIQQHLKEAVAGSSILLLVFFCLAAFTKSAQFPFTSWLPAAMAAPTPVSALVHSSTLVTAGIWLLIRFSSNSVIFSVGWLMFGLVTLLVASLAALKEVDAKKIVALSTLSQLGLMVLALVVSNKTVSLFHLFMHALAKANLFLVVGGMIHSCFSQQDSRFMFSKSEFFLSKLLMTVSVASLSGIALFSGFFSKEFILVLSTTLINSILSMFLLLGIVSLTFAYCYKLISSSLFPSFFIFMSTKNSSASYFFPCLVLSSMSVNLGSLFLFNYPVYFNWMYSNLGFLWLFLLLAFLLLMKSLEEEMVMKWFYEQVNFIVSATMVTFKKVKMFMMILFSSLLENIFLMVNSLLLTLDLSFMMMLLFILMLCLIFIL